MQRKWKRRWQRLAKLLLPPVASGVLLLSAYGPVFANPAGSTVTSGAASIATNAKTMTVTQTTDKAAINWQSFNISSGEKVQFIQPGTSSVALNRVVGNDASSIYGTLSANGKVFLINPNGVLFAPGAQINTGGLVASTLNISDKNFVTGNYTFSGSGAGSVVNRGTITAANEAVLIGPQVKNEGVIAAKVTGLASGNKVSLDFSGDNLLNVAVDTGAAGGSAVNNGTITADGGLVVMSAGTKDALLTTVVNNSGIIRAQSVNKTNGVIRLEGNRAINSGTLDASGKAAGQTGGTIKVLGDTVTLAQDSNIDVSGDAGGGTTLIGGNFHGQGTEYTATATIVDQGAAITADALTMGNGGKVAVWSNSTTTFAGTISAKGGSKSGSGGSVETSGHTLTVASTAKVNTLADHGTTGSWLLDPYNFTIDDTGTAGMKAADLSADLQASNVTIQTLDGRVSASGVPQTISCTAASNGDINVNSEVDWSSHTLTLSAYNNIHINAPMNAAGTAGLALEYGQAAAAGNTCSYYVNAPVNLASTASFSTKLGSSGATNTYTIVNSTDGLAQMNFSSDYYALGTNLDFNGQGRTTSVIPIFSGTLAGLGHTISNLTIHSDNIGYIGLFGASGGTIRDVGLIDDTVTSTGNNSYNVGGLVGLNAGGTITDCYATGSVSATGSSTYAGGLVGQNDNGTITNCYSTGSVSGNSAGGLVGWNYYGGTIKDCYATGTVSGNSAGGLAGKNTNNATIADCYATGTVSATASSSYVGGLVGQNDVSSTISNCYWDVFSSNTTAGVGYGGTGTNGSIAGVTSGSDTSIYHSAFSKASYAFTDAAGADNFDADWYMIDGSTRPFLRSEYSTTITNAHQLQLIAMNLGANYTLGNNIDMSELTQNSGLWRTVNTKDSNGNYGFVPIDDGANSFTGTFDGDVHTIKGLTITSNASCVGLFGSSTGTIRDVGLEHDTITGTGNNGYYYPVGGLVGYNYNGTITNCYATGTVSTTTSNSYVGGLVGWNHNGTITNCYAAGTVSTTASYSDVGGLVGNNLHGTITDCYAVETASATASISSVGGLVGGNGGTIKDCYAMGTVSGTGSSSDVGGLVGYNGSGIKITDCYAAEAVSATDSSSSVGGLAGKNDGTVGVDSTGASSPCYWDTSRTTNGYGSNNGTFNPTLGGTAASGGLTTAQAKDTSYYSGWDFNSTWYRADSVNNDYPILRSSPYVLTIIANNKTITYGEAIPHLTYSCDKLWAGDTTDVITGLSLSTTTATTPAAGSYIITAGGASATSSNGQSYIIIYKDGTLTINKRPIIINPTPGQSKIYGNDDPALTYSVGATTSDTGIVNNDSVSYTGALARNSGENARDYPITLGNLVSANSNYTVSLSTAPVNFTITQRPIIITPTAGQSKIYGNDDPALTYSVGAADANTGIVNNDRVSYTGALSRNTGENAANYAITAGNLSSTNSNYAVSLRTAPVNFTITQRPIIITPTAGQSKIYGNDDPTLTYSVVAADANTGIVNNDRVSYTGALSRNTGENAADYAITAGNLASTNSNYTVSLRTAPVNFTITQRPIIITPTTGQSKIYGNSDPTLTYSVGAADANTGIVNNDRVSYTGALSRNTGENAADYAITAGNLASTNSNYTVSLRTAPVNFTITQRPIIITPTTGQSKIYGNDDPTLTYSVVAATANTGIVNNDSVSYTGALSRNTGENAANYAITAGNLTSANGNYTVSLRTAPVSFTITQRPIIITPTTGQNKIYGNDDPALTYSVGAADANTGIVGNDSVSYTGALSRNSGENAADYAITAGNLTSANGNYTVSLRTAPVNFTITQRPIIITPTTGQSKIYGNDDPALTYSVGAADANTGIVGNDSVSYTGALSRNSGENAADYAITAGNLASTNSNYTVSLRTAPVNFTITQRPISYSITSTTAVYGSVAPGTVTWSNLCGGDDPGAVISVSNSGGSPVSSLATASVGTYSETVSSLSNSNYTLASTGSTPGTLTITPRPLTWSVANTAIVYGTAAVPGAASLTGIVNNDMVNAVVTVYDGANTAVSLSPATKTGTYSERVTAISNSNYTLAATGNTPGILTINTAPWQSDSYTGAVGTAEQRAIPGFINAAPLFRTAGFQLPDSLTVIPPGINLTGCLPLTDSELSRLSKPDKQ